MNFHKFVIGMWQKYNFPLFNIGNKNKESMNFDMINNRTNSRNKRHKNVSKLELQVMKRSGL